MLDPVFVRNNPEVVQASQVKRSEDPQVVLDFLAADEVWRTTNATLNGLQSQLKAESRAVGALKKDPAAQGIAKEQARQTSDKVNDAQEQLKVLEAKRDEAMRRISNVVIDDVPAGGEDDFDVLEEVGNKPTFDFPIRDHVEIATGLGILDLERGARTSGSRFYYLLGKGARLERALANLAHDLAEDAGYLPVTAPVLVAPKAMEGTGFLGKHADEVYHLPADNLYLVGTSEVPLAAFHAEEIVEGTKRYVSTTTCFRREAGSHGRDTRGIFRVHQFQKTEMFVFCAPNDAEAEHQRLLQMEKKLLDLLELPYRVIDVAAGDLGSSAARKFDIEAWIPSQERYREVTSTSNCTTFQGRRLKVRYRDENGKPQPMATINGTLAASTRLIVAILENHQQADGTVKIPEALRAYMGGTTHL